MQASSTNTGFDVLLFDLDGTLYSADCGYVEHQRENMFSYVRKQNWVPEGKSVVDVWRPLFQKYNQSLRGWKAAGFKVDEDEYWAESRKGMEDFIKPDLPLRSFLDAIPSSTRKYIFTNCNEKEALQALDCLGVSDHFLHIYGSKFMKDVCKPEREAFELVLRHLDPESAIPMNRICMFEDSYKNLVTANELGMATVFIESNITAGEEGVTDEQKGILDAIVPTLSDEGGKEMAKLLPQLFR
eukprot:GSChrysophyteH1.ASY1.ANO1.2877.1 assembled CDS